MTICSLPPLTEDLSLDRKTTGAARDKRARRYFVAEMLAYALFITAGLMLMPG